MIILPVSCFLHNLQFSRYSDTHHSFTVWQRDADNPMADSRSWWSMMSLFDSIVRGEEWGNHKRKDEMGSSTIAIVEVEGEAPTDDDVDSLDSAAHGDSKEMVVVVVTAAALLLAVIR